MLTPKMYDSMHKIHNNLGCLAVSLDAGTKETMQNRSDWGEVIEAIEPSGNDDGRGSKVDW